MDSERVKLRSASQRFLRGKTIDESLFARKVERKEIGEERMQENVEMRKEREVYLKIVRKWLGKRSAACFFRRRRENIACVGDFPLPNRENSIRNED